MNERTRNLHHLSFNRKFHKTGQQRLYRTMGLTAVRMDIDSHNELHHEIPNPPQPPSGRALQMALYSLRSMMVDGVDDPLRVMNRLIDEYGQLSLNTDDRETSRIAAEHEEFLIRQYPFIREGKPLYIRTD